MDQDRVLAALRAVARDAEAEIDDDVFVAGGLVAEVDLPVVAPVSQHLTHHAISLRIAHLGAIVDNRQEQMKGRMTK